MNQETAPPLSFESGQWPNIIDTIVKMVPNDTFDAAIDTTNGKYRERISDFMPVCVLNFANAFQPGGGWDHGAPAQEEQLFFRSTLSASLDRKFYPKEPFECMYSPRVIIFRENHSKQFEYLAGIDRPESLPVVSLVSMAAKSRPPSDIDDPTWYANKAVRDEMYTKLQQVLRTAAHNNHRRLILGAIGCGKFYHPPEEVSALWANSLEEIEFTGWFEQVIFAVFDPSEEGMRYHIFKQTLENLLEPDIE